MLTLVFVLIAYWIGLNRGKEKFKRDLEIQTVKEFIKKNPDVIKNL